MCHCEAREHFPDLIARTVLWEREGKRWQYRQLTFSISYNCAFWEWVAVEKAHTHTHNAAGSPLHSTQFRTIPSNLLSARKFPHQPLRLGENRHTLARSAAPLLPKIRSLSLLTSASPPKFPETKPAVLWVFKARCWNWYFNSCNLNGLSNIFSWCFVCKFKSSDGATPSFLIRSPFSPWRNDESDERKRGEIVERQRDGESARLPPFAILSHNAPQSFPSLIQMQILLLNGSERAVIQRCFVKCTMLDACRGRGSHWLYEQNLSTKSGISL